MELCGGGADGCGATAAALGAGGGGGSGSVAVDGVSVPFLLVFPLACIQKIIRQVRRSER